MIKIELSPHVLRRLKWDLFWSGKREIGGMLFAEQLDNGIFNIIDYSVDKQSGTYKSFIRSPEKHKRSLDIFFKKTGYDYKRYNYLGEWHSHPMFSVDPSLEDVESMQKLIVEEETISFAALMIVKYNFMERLEHSISLFTK